VTVTLNPSIDRTIRVDRLVRGGVNRAQIVALDAGGKGVNVSRALAVYGAETHAIMIGANLGALWFREVLDAAGVPHTMVMTEGVTRSNITLLEADGTVTKINEPGVTLQEAAISDVESALAALALDGAWVVFAGRLNPGAPADTYLRLARFAKQRGAMVAVDVSGQPLDIALRAGAVDLIKPNQHELGEIVGRQLRTIGAVVEAAREVIDRGVATVVCSLGRDGALYITADQVQHAECAEEIVGTPVGAGDILLATFIGGGANAEALEGAVRWSAASVKLPGTAIPTPEQAAAIPVTRHAQAQLTRQLVEVS
ncbi:MAG: 1-phosphofructokinase family hexose kinase, partial [Candidatus Nanopelagicales bacterium]